MASEVISAEAFEALKDTYLAHPKYCECQSCMAMDALLNEMCIETECRKPCLPGRWGCEDHPHHGPEGGES